MDLQSGIYLAILIAGVVLLAVSFLFGEIGDLFDGGVDSGDGPGILSVSIIGAALSFLGGTGLLVTRLGWDVIPSLLLALLIGIAGAFSVRQFFLKPLMKQQGNSHIGRDSYVGINAIVTLEIMPKGWGEVRFIDANGASVFSKAISGSSRALTVNQQVTITQIAADQVVVDPIAPSNK